MLLLESCVVLDCSNNDSNVHQTCVSAQHALLTNELLVRPRKSMLTAVSVSASAAILLRPDQLMLNADSNYQFFEQPSANKQLNDTNTYVWSKRGAGSLARGRLGVYSSISKPAVPVGAPGEQLKAGCGHCCVVLGHSHHCHLPPTQACDCPWHNDGTFPTVHMKIEVACIHSVKMEPAMPDVMLSQVNTAQYILEALHTPHTHQVWLV